MKGDNLICPVCQTEFIAKTKRSVACSREHHQKAMEILYPGKQAAYNREWQLANPKRVSSYARNWQARHPERDKINRANASQKAKERKWAQDGFKPGDERLCLMCKQPFKATNKGHVCCSHACASKKWNYDHPGASNELSSNWQKENKTKVRAYQKAWRDKNKDKIRLYNQRSAAKRKETL